MKENNGIFLNADKIVKTNNEEIEKLDFYNENVDKIPHIDTPLSIEHELEILEKAGFKNISVLEVEKDNYRLFKAYKEE